MPGEDGKIVYRVVVDADGAIVEAERAGEEVGERLDRGSESGRNNFEQAMIGAARRIGEAFVEMAVKAVQGVEEIAKAGIEFNAKMEQYKTAFTTLLGSAEEAQAVMAQIRADAASTPFDVDSLTQANQMLISAGISADQAREDILNLANAIAATGGGSAELARMAANMQQIQNTGKATAMDIRQFANAGINIYGLLADAMGVTTEEASQMDVTYEQLAAALANAAASGGAYEGALEAQSQTFTGRLSTLQDNITQLEGVLTEDLFATLSDTALPMVMDWVAALLEAAETGGIEGALQAAGEILHGLIDQFIEGLPEMIDIGLTLLEGLLTGIGEALPQIIQTAVTVIGKLVMGLANHIPQLVLAGIDLLIGLITGLLKAIPQLLAMLPEIIKSLITGLLNHLPELITAGIQLLIAVATGLIEALPQLIMMLPQIIMAIINAFREVDWSELGIQIVEGVWNGITSLWSSLVDSVRNAVRNLWESAKQVLGIASPSKKFKYIGEMSVEGIEEGFEDGEDDLTRTVRNVYTGMLDAAGGASGVTGRGDMERAVSYSLSATSAGAAQIIVPLSIDGREIARATAWTMGEQLAWEEI